MKKMNKNVAEARAKHAPSMAASGERAKSAVAYTDICLVIRLSRSLRSRAVESF
jgi:hypothetical protein